MIVDCKAGTEIVFDFNRQAWFPDSGVELSPGFPARAVLVAPVKFDGSIGMRSSDISFTAVERYKAPEAAPLGEVVGR